MRALDWPCWAAPSMIESWDALARCAAEPNPFLESWYLLPALRALDPAETVSILKFEVDGALCGMIPMRREKRYYGRRIANLERWTHPNCFLGAPLVAAGRERAFWRALFDWADRNAGPALFLHLTDLPLGQPLHRALDAVLAEQQRPGGIVLASERAMLQSDAAPEDYFVASSSGKERRELKRKLARLSDLGEVRFERETGDDRLAEWTERFLELENAGWKGARGSSLAASPATGEFFRQSIAGAARQGRFERLSLTLDGKPIAMLSSFLCPPAGFGFKSAFDEAYARFSPGMLLQCEHLMILENRDIRWFDSCATRSNAMVDHLWRERRSIGHISVGIGGRLRRGLFRRLLASETRRTAKASAQ